jgi:hypothetical protein
MFYKIQYVSRGSQDIRRISIKLEFLSIIIVFILACTFLIIYIHLLLYTFIGIKISLFIFYILFNIQDLLVKKPLAVTILGLQKLLISL